MNHISKILPRKDLLERICEQRKQGSRIVFTNGCFDLIHRGHVDLLSGARSLGDILVVAVNSDDSVRKLKGAGRPLQSEEDRAAVIAALESVTCVVVFSEETPHDLIVSLKPDVLVKGDDYRKEEVVGWSEVEKAGGSVVLWPLADERSTSSLIRRIRELGADEL